MKAQRSMVNASAGVDCEWRRGVAIVDGWRQRGDQWWMKAKWSMVNEREIEDQKFMIRPGLGESKTAKWFLRDIKDGIFSALVNINLHPQILQESTGVDVVHRTLRTENLPSGVLSPNPRHLHDPWHTQKMTCLVHWQKKIFIRRYSPECTVVEVVEERRRWKLYHRAWSRRIQDSYSIPERHKRWHT